MSAPVGGPGPGGKPGGRHTGTGTGTGTQAGTFTLSSGAFTLPGALPGRLREVDAHLSGERARAVDAEELAAFLEADGLGDETLRDRYGVAGLFDAAETLYRQRGTGRDLNKRAALPTPPFPWAMLLRGPLYLLPGVTGLLAARQLGTGASEAFVFAAAFGWGWTMLVAGVRYAEPLAVPGRALRLTLLLSVVLGTLGGALISGLLVGWGAAGTGALLGGAVSLATGAASVLLALNLPGQFAGAFATPLLAAGIVYMLPSLAGARVVLVLLGLVPLLTTLNATRKPGTLAASWRTLRPHVPAAAYGWAMAGAFVALTARLGAWALLPVVLSAGLLEAGVWHAQERLQHAARASLNLGELRRRGLPTVLAVTAGYGLALAAGLLLLRGVLPPAWQPAPNTLLSVPPFGAALLLSAWLHNQRRTPLLTLVWVLCAAALVLPLGLSPPAIAWAALLALLPPTLFALQDPRSYR
ncbi:hypothetical protein ACFSR9_04095 [Deinococcus taklimakanensis]|uniref:Integral membrane protein n=1 Tax=Deinococcus taklimakanensis TaxID=536443 RepID=A0ABW5P053_9DEIO